MSGQVLWQEVKMSINVKKIQNINIIYYLSIQFKDALNLIPSTIP